MTKEEMLEIMNEFVKQECIDFIKWQRGVQYLVGRPTPEEWYEMYLKSKSKK